MPDTAEPTELTTPAASTPSDMGGDAPMSQSPARAMSSQLATPDAYTSMRTPSGSRPAGSGRSRISTGPPNSTLPAPLMSPGPHIRPREQPARPGGAWPRPG